MRVIKLQSS